MHALAPLLGLLAAADALGAWTANGAHLALSDEQGKIVGRLSAEGGPCDLPAGTPLLNGTLLDDSLSAQVRLCLIAAECGPSQETALAVLLVTRTLTGGVHTKAGCAKDVHALVLRRPGAPMAMTPPPFNVRLAKTPAPKSPRAPPSSLNYIAASEKLPTAQVGEIPGRPVGESQHPNYDPRDARNAATPKSEADRMMRDGAALLQEGRFERARELFRGAAAKDPQRPEAYNGVGVTYYARGDLEEALAWYKRSLEADPRFGDAFYNMGCAYALQGKRDLAFRYLRMAALNHYSEVEQMQKDPDLEALRGEPQWREIIEQMGK